MPCSGGSLHPPGGPLIPPGVPSLHPPGCSAAHPPGFPWTPRVSSAPPPPGVPGPIPGAPLRPPRASPEPSSGPPAPAAPPPPGRARRCGVGTRRSPAPRLGPVPPPPRRRRRRPPPGPALTQLSREQTPRQAPMARPRLPPAPRSPPPPRWLRPGRPRGPELPPRLPPGRPPRRRGRVPGPSRPQGSPSTAAPSSSDQRERQPRPCLHRRPPRGPRRHRGPGPERGLWGGRPGPQRRGSLSFPSKQPAGRARLLRGVPRGVLSVFAVNRVPSKRPGRGSGPPRRLSPEQLRVLQGAWGHLAPGSRREINEALGFRWLNAACAA